MKSYINSNERFSSRQTLIFLSVIVMIQPVLDIASFFASNANVSAISTIARFALLAVVTLYGFIISDKKKHYYILIGLLSVFFTAHFIANYVSGYQSIMSDIAMYLRVVQLPLFYLAFNDIFRQIKADYDSEEVTKIANVLIVVNLIIISLSIVLSYLLGIPEFTYYNATVGAFGVKGWFLTGNSQSVIICVIASITLLVSIKAKNVLISIVLIALSIASLFFFGTKLTFYSIFLIGAALIVITLLSKNKHWLKLGLVVLSLGIVYVCKDYSPMHINTYYTNIAFDEWQNEINDIETEVAKPDPGKPESNLTGKDYFLENVDLYTKVYSLYTKDLVEQFGIEKVAEKYNYSLNADSLINNRNSKLVAVSLVYDQSSTAQHLFGFEQAAYTIGGTNYDLENDLHGIFYSYGYIGFAIYISLFIYILIRGIGNYFFVKENRFNENLGIYLVALVLILGAAQFSGNVLKRPNVLFYISYILSLITISTFSFKEMKHKNAKRRIPESR